MSDAAGDDRSRLVRALALSRRFHLYLVRVESPRAADQLVSGLAGELRGLGREEVRLVRLDPYAGRATAEPIVDAELTDRVLVPLLDPPEDVRGAIHVVDASRAPYADVDAWARVFSLWNEKRNVLGADRGEVLVLLPRALEAVFPGMAPDVWSIRSGEYVVREAAPSALATGGGMGAPLLDARLLIGAAPPLTLFGGDLVVRPWMEDLLLSRSAWLWTEPLLRSMPAWHEYAFAMKVLNERRFTDAEALFTRLLSKFELLPRLVDYARSGLCVALAAQDRAPEALKLQMESPSVASANAYWCWCLGRLEAADQSDFLGQTHAGAGVSHILQLIERGQVPTEATVQQERFLPMSFALRRVITVDLKILADDMDGARSSLEYISLTGYEQDRRNASLAILEMVRGNDARAAHLLSSTNGANASSEEDPDAGCRITTLHAFASGILSANCGDSAAARTWLGSARHHVHDWGRYGFDRRSRLRARAMVELCLTQLHPDAEAALAMARTLAADTEALLGDTGEDCVARAIAVLAHNELARRLAVSAPRNAPEAARHAIALAEPLRALNVPGWTAVLRAAERRHAEITGAR